MTENDRIRERITDIRREFVKTVDPYGDILDYLVQNRVVNNELYQRLRAIATRQERCREMLNELQGGGNPQAFIVLREALRQDYSHIVDMIDQTTTGASSVA